MIESEHIPYTNSHLLSVRSPSHAFTRLSLLRLVLTLQVAHCGSPHDVRSTDALISSRTINGLREGGRHTKGDQLRLVFGYDVRHGSISNNRKNISTNMRLALLECKFVT
jgi:hypothetical protein